jgi:hypothetical protein
MIFLLIFPIIFGIANADAINKFNEETDKGAEWHYVGKQPLDPNAKSIALEMDGEEPYIMYKLKMPAK